MTTEIERANWEFYNQTLRGAQEQLPRNERALATINGTIGEALGKLYVEEHFPAEAKEKAEEMIANVVKAFENRINNLTWMSDSTKVKAIEKLSTTTIKVQPPFYDYKADAAVNYGGIGAVIGLTLSPTGGRKSRSAYVPENRVKPINVFKNASTTRLPS